MILDNVILAWCRENYDLSRDSEFQAYAKYVALRPWVRGLTLHSIFLWILFLGQLAIAIPLMKTIDAGSLFTVAIQLLTINGICTLAFIPYGFKKYHLNDGTTLFFYFLMAFAIYTLCRQMPQAGQTAFTVAMLPVSLVLHHVLPVLMNKNAKQMRSFHATQQLEAEDAKATMDKAEFDSWVNRQRSAYTGEDPELLDSAHLESAAFQNLADLIGYVEETNQHTEYMELSPEEDRGIIEAADIAQEPEKPMDPPADETDPVDDFYKQLFNED